MAYMISDSCLQCGGCEVVCTNHAIKEKSGSYMVDLTKCTECVGVNSSPMCVEVCPVAAPVPDPDNKESRDQLLDKWKRLHPGENPKL